MNVPRVIDMPARCTDLSRRLIAVAVRGKEKGGDPYNCPPTNPYREIERSFCPAAARFARLAP